MKRKLSVLLFGALLFTMYGCGKNNIFSFAHSAGNSSGTSALSSDASQALQNKDYNKALQYYSQILQSNPNNSQAIYGYCAAELANSGMDISSLVANLVKQQSGAPARLAPALAYAANTSLTSSSNLIPLTIITNRVAIEKAVNDVLSSKYLLKIIKGNGDGTIAPDNVDVNVNIAFCLVLRAALKVIDSGSITFNSDYTVTVNSTDISVANDAGRDIASAYQRLLKVAKKLNLGSDAAITKINNDVNNLFNDLKKQIPAITVKINEDYYAESN